MINFKLISNVYNFPAASMQLGEGHELHIVTRTLALTDLDRCQLVIKLTPSTALNNVQLTITVIPPLLAVPATHHIPSLCESFLLL